MAVLIPLAMLLGVEFVQARKYSATPISKVVDLLKEMKVKGDAAMKDEATKFSAFEQWCGNQKRIKTNEIASGEATMEELSAAIMKHDVGIKGLTSRIEELDEDVGRWEKDTKSTMDIRQKEEADYGATLQDYTETLDALDEAIAVLKKRAVKVDQPESETWQGALLQLTKRSLIPLTTKSALFAFLQQAQPDVEAMPDSDLFKSNKQAYAYEFQSQGVVDMLEKLKDEFSQKKYEMDREELTAKHAFEQMVQQLADSMENAKHEVSKKTATRAETQQARADAQGELAQVTADRDEDKNYLMETEALCKVKKDDFDNRQTLRAGELEAISKAIAIISSDAVAGVGEKKLPTLAQLGGSSGGAALAQLRSDQVTPLQQRIATFLADRARVSGSKLLMMVSERVSVDPFTKVKKMIKDLIFKLMEEATAETEHKGWCDAELATNKHTRESKTEDVNKLTAEKEELAATIADLTQRVEDLSGALAELAAAVAETVSDRAASKAENEKTIQEAKDAQVAVQQAIAVLKEFYAKSAEATALAQQSRQSPAQDAPETFDKPYQGLLPEGGSVVDFLEVILADFTRLEADTESTEAAELEEYKKYMFEAEKDKALKEGETKHKQEAITSKTSELHSTEEELTLTQDQLDKALAYYEKLKPDCVDSGITYEERVKRREAEIQSLQEALKILTGVGI